MNPLNQRRGPLSFFFLATFILILSAITASAATYYVAPSGGDSNSGAMASPWRTIQRAADAVSPGDVVQVAPGTYPETILSRRGGTATARIRFVSTTKWGAKIVSSTTGGGAAWQNEASYVDIEGFEVTGQAAYGIRNQKASYTRIVGNHVHDIPALNCVPGGGLAEGGYSAVPMPSNNEYAGNLVHHIGPAPGTCNQSHGIYLTLPYAKAYNNIVYNSAGRGIQLYHAITNAVVMNNTLFGSGDGIVVNADTSAGYYANDSLIANNICYRNVHNGIYSGGGFGTGNQITNNLVYGNGTNWGTLPHTNDIVGDPGFVNATGSYFTGNYRLSSTSPGIDRGTTLNAPSSDFDSANRPGGSGPDVGAYEQATTATSASLAYYVSPNGSDSNSGTSTAPWQTIQHAATMVSAGAIVYVAPGTYYETIQSTRSGTSPSRIRFFSTVKWGAKIVSPATGAASAWRNDGDYVDIQGFDISGQGSYGLQNYGSAVRVLSNHVHDIPATGCQVGAGIGEAFSSTGTLPVNNEYTGNLVHDVGPAPGTCNQAHGIYVALPYAKVFNNIVYNNAGRGIQMYRAASNAVVMNNTLFGNGSGIVINADTSAGYSNSYSLIANNICYQNVQYGIYSGSGYGVNNRITNNLAYGNSKDWGSMPHSNDIVGSPEFINPTGSYFGGDYRIFSTSPAIDRGLSEQAPKSDFALGSRPVGTAPDAGAYEYGATAGAWSWQ